ncbi:hypothetical protein M5K25_015576 [Dendrobium thyrsiflorum]|uniref:Uncharacterized protein n=1 Tax=Dendrobium thyrsiflorum TaxID=117978 RepID=A0ABD0UY12_DENTH
MRKKRRGSGGSLFNDAIEFRSRPAQDLWEETLLQRDLRVRQRLRRDTRGQQRNRGSGGLVREVTARSGESSSNSGFFGMAAKKVDALEERLEGEMNQIKETVEERSSSMEGQMADLRDVMKKMLEFQTQSSASEAKGPEVKNTNSEIHREEEEVKRVEGRRGKPHLKPFQREERGGRYGERQGHGATKRIDNGNSFRSGSTSLTSRHLKKRNLMKYIVKVRRSAPAEDRRPPATPKVGLVAYCLRQLPHLPTLLAPIQTTRAAPLSVQLVYRLMILQLMASKKMEQELLHNGGYVALSTFIK